MAKAFNKKRINDNFFSLFKEKSRAELSSLLGVSQGNLSEWANGKKQVPWDKLAYAIELSGRTWDWMLARTDDDSAVSPSPQTEKPEGSESALRIIKGTPYPPAPVPVYSSAVADSHHAEEGARIVATDAIPEGYFTLPDGCCGIRIEGDSMEPVAREGQVAILAPEDRSAVNGDLVVVTLKNDSGTYFKRFHKTKHKGVAMITLSSDNPTKAIPPMVVDEDEIADLRVVIGVRFEMGEYR